MKFLILIVIMGFFLSIENYLNRKTDQKNLKHTKYHFIRIVVKGYRKTQPPLNWLWLLILFIKIFQIRRPELLLSIH